MSRSRGKTNSPFPNSPAPAPLSARGERAETIRWQPFRATLVIPGRNAAATLPACLEAACRILGSDGLQEIIFVDDGSSDNSREVVSRFPVRYVQGLGRGPGSARNLGWRAATTEYVWFIDADCVAQRDALNLLARHAQDASVGGVGGSYGNMRQDSLLACLIHEEIIQRHLRMPRRVDVLSTFNVLYRRSVLEEVGGFDERMVNGRGSAGAEDVELAFRVCQAGYRLRFEPNSRVGHFHPTRLTSYLRVQRHHGYWRVPLYMRHSRRAKGDSYSGVIDHLQPPLAMLLLLLLPLLGTSCWWLPLLVVASLILAQLPMTMKLLLRTRRARYVVYAPLGFLRAFYRGFGMTGATLAVLHHLQSMIARAVAAKLFRHHSPAREAPVFSTSKIAE